MEDIERIKRVRLRRGGQHTSHYTSIQSVDCGTATSELSLLYNIRAFAVAMQAVIME
jgi:hypothetical protein